MTIYYDEDGSPIYSDEIIQDISDKLIMQEVEFRGLISQLEIVDLFKELTQELDNENTMHRDILVDRINKILRIT